jgi:hypothetical protein
VLACVAVIASSAGCAPSCEELSAETNQQIVDLSTGCTTSADCRAVGAGLITSLVGEAPCAASCGFAARADVDDATVRARFSSIVDDEQGCVCGRPRCPTYTAVCEANRCVTSF